MMSANVILVEGKDEKRTLPEILEIAGIDWGERGSESYRIVEFDGVENLLKPGEITAYLKATNVNNLVVIIDADTSPQRRWDQLCAALNSAVPLLPQEIPSAGFVTTLPSGRRFGAWLMPDNNLPGMLEDWLLSAISFQSDDLLQFAARSVEHSRAHGSPFIDSHTTKAQLHTYLAWQNPPGNQLHIAAKSKLFHIVESDPFVQWFKNVFKR